MCSLPGLSSEIGERDYKRMEKESEKQMEKEEMIKEKIIKIKNEMNKERK